MATSTPFLIPSTSWHGQMEKASKKNMLISMTIFPEHLRFNVLKLYFRFEFRVIFQSIFANGAALFPPNNNCAKSAFVIFVFLLMVFVHNLPVHLVNYSCKSDKNCNHI